MMLRIVGIFLLYIRWASAYDSKNKLDVLRGQYHYPDETVYQVVHRWATDLSNPQFIAFSTLLLSESCGGTRLVSKYLNNNTASITLWLPTDQGVWNALGGRKVPFRGWSCPVVDINHNDGDSNNGGGNNADGNNIDGNNGGGDNGNATNNHNTNIAADRLPSMCMKNPTPRSISSLSQMVEPFDSLRPCLPDILNYHVVPHRQFLLLNYLDGLSHASATLETALMSQNSHLVQLANGTSQVLAVNQTTSNNQINSTVQYGALPPARVLQPNITCSNGVIQVIDRMMIPPANLTRTLEILGLTFYQSALRSGNQEDLIVKHPSITIFLPESANQAAPSIPKPVYESLSGPTSFNFTHYTFPQLVYANQTQSDDTVDAAATTTNFTISSLGDSLANITYGSDYSLYINGSKITVPNILLENGVLHLYKS